MKKLSFDEEKIELSTEKKKLFSKENQIFVITIPIEEIESASSEMIGDTLNSSTLIKKDGEEIFIAADELEDASKLSEMLEFLKSKGINVELIEI